MASVDQFISNLRLMALRIEREREKIMTVAAHEVLSEMQQRIFSKGVAVDNSMIGQYSNKPIYMPVPMKQVKNKGFKRIGKTGKKTKKTQYFEGGYKEFRQKAGREANKVNLDLTGSLRLSMAVGNYNNGKVIFFNQPESIKKARGNEERFGKKIFGASKQERELFTNTVAKHINSVINDTLS